MLTSEQDQKQTWDSQSAVKLRLEQKAPSKPNRFWLMNKKAPLSQHAVPRHEVAQRAYLAQLEQCSFFQIVQAILNDRGFKEINFCDSLLTRVLALKSRWQTVAERAFHQGRPQMSACFYLKSYLLGGKKERWRLKKAIESLGKSEAVEDLRVALRLSEKYQNSSSENDWLFSFLSVSEENETGGMKALKENISHRLLNSHVPDSPEYRQEERFLANLAAKN